MLGTPLSLETIETPEQVKAWSRFLKTVRNFFDERGYLEVTTPTLVASSSVDAALDPIKLNVGGEALELPTSPEFEMKAIFARTQLPIYQICKSYRDDPKSPIHRKEFSMLEFYAPDCDLSRTKREMCELLNELCGKDLRFDEYTVAQLVKEKAGVDLFTDRDGFARQLNEKVGIDFSESDTWEDLFSRVMIEKVEPAIGAPGPCVLTDFPASLSSLSIIEGNPPVAKRFEIYWKGMELCNGFNELTDPQALLSLYDREKTARVAQRKPPHPFPHRLLKAMQMGLPRSSGVAVGLDRLFTCVRAEIRD